MLLAYALLSLAGVLTHRPGFSLAAVILLFSLMMSPMLATRRWSPWLLWLALLSTIGLLAWHGLLGPLLESVPVVLNVLLAWLFGRTLRAGRMPMIARFIEGLEGPARLEQPGVRRYARQLTWFWTLLPALQALLLAVLLTLAVPAGLLDTLGVAVPWPLPARWALDYVHVGSYMLFVLALLLEYPFRCWHLRHLPHLRLRDFLLRMFQLRSQLMYDKGSSTP